MTSVLKNRIDATQSELTPSEAIAISMEASIYAFPMIDHYRILHSYFVDKSHPQYKGPWNVIHHSAHVCAPDDKSVQTPNLDLQQSVLGADLRAEPMVLTVPGIDNGRYYSVQFIDLYTFNFFYIGTRTTGNDSGSFLLAGPHWKGQRPPGIRMVIRSETDLVLAIYQTQLLSSTDIENVIKIQSAYQVQTLSQFLGTPAPAAMPEIDFRAPVAAEQERTSLEILNILNFLLQFCSIHPSELDLMGRFARLGIKADREFYDQGLSPEIRQAIEDGMTDAWRAETKLVKHIREGRAGGIKLFGSREYMENNYLNRMAAAAIGIHANSWEEMTYYEYCFDSAGHSLNAKRRHYQLRFRAGQLPPVNAFWSVTLYELPARLLNANKLNRYMINSLMIPGMRRDDDGGLTILIQHDTPGEDKESNWLPAPPGPFMLTLRMYAPRPEILRWSVPSVDRPK